jgi:hypothetical protein
MAPEGAGCQLWVGGQRLQRRDSALQLAVDRDRQRAGDLDARLRGPLLLMIDEGQERKPRGHCKRQETGRTDKQEAATE